MPLTNWRSIQSDGTLPNEGAASEVQYRRFLNWSVDLDIIGIGSTSGTGRWTIQILNGSSVIFEQKVELTLRIVSLGAVGLSLFTWQVTREKITTTWIAPAAANVVSNIPGIVAPISVDNTNGSGIVYDANNVILNPGQVNSVTNPSWMRVLGGAAPTSEFGTMIQGGGSGVAVPGIPAIIEAFWQSPVYEYSLPSGCRLHVVMDSWGLGANSRPEWQFSFEEASADFSATLDRQGAIRMITTRGRALDMRLTYDSQSLLQRRAPLKNASNPQLWRDESNRIWMLALHNNQWKLWYSDLGGFDLLPAIYSNSNDDETNTGEQVALFPDSFTNVDIAPRKGGGYAAIGQRSGKVFFIASSDGIVPGPMKEVGLHNNLPCKILVGATSDGSARMEILDGGETHYESLDGGLEWVSIQ